MRAENRQLKEQIEQMRLEQVRLSEDAAQARRLQTLLAFKEQFISRTVAAQVIGSSGSDLSRIIYIDKGENAGIKRDMAVMTADGIVGKVLVVYPSVSQVLLISDQSSGVGAILEKTRLQGVLRGTANGEVVLERVMSDEQVPVGETVLTSGGDQIFPKGLPVGTVTKVGNGKDLFLNIKIKPAANLSKLEEVLVLVEKQERQATAEENVRVRAADILAQRLPSVPDKPATMRTPRRKTGHDRRLTKTGGRKDRRRNLRARHHDHRRLRRIHPARALFPARQRLEYPRSRQWNARWDFRREERTRRPRRATNASCEVRSPFHHARERLTRSRPPKPRQAQRYARPIRSRPPTRAAHNSVPITYTSNEQVEVYRFSIPVTIGVPLLALFVQAFLPLRFPRFAVYFDLPLLVTIFFAMARRSPVAGLFTGAVIGLAQDMLGHNPDRNLWNRQDRRRVRSFVAGRETRRGKRRRPLSGDAGVLSDPLRGLFHGCPWAGQHDPELELAARHSGRPGQRDPRRGAVLPAGQVQAENVKQGRQFPVLSSQRNRGCDFRYFVSNSSAAG